MQPEIIVPEPVNPAVHIAAICRPFSTEPHLLTIKEGATLHDILFEAVPDSALHPYAVVTLEGEEIAPGCYRLVRPKAGKSVAIRVVPRGGGGKKNIFATIAMIAVAIVATAFGQYYVYPALGGAAGGIGASAGAAFATVAVPLAGPLHVGQLPVPPL